MASKTCEGSSEPDVHAEPLEPQTPFWSSKMSIDSPSINLKHTFTLFGSLLTLSPFNLA